MEKIVLSITIPSCGMNHEIISLLSTLGLRDEIVQINEMTIYIYIYMCLYRQSRKERNTFTIHIAMARAVLVDSKIVILGRKERRLDD